MIGVKKPRNDRTRVYDLAGEWMENAKIVHIVVYTTQCTVGPDVAIQFSTILQKRVLGIRSYSQCAQPRSPGNEVGMVRHRRIVGWI